MAARTVTPRRLVAVRALLLLLPLLSAAPAPAQDVAAALDAALAPAVLDGAADRSVVAPGEEVVVSGALLRRVDQLDLVPVSGATFTAVLARPNGEQVDVDEVTTAADGSFSVTVPGSATATIQPTAATGWRETVALRAVGVEAVGWQQDLVGGIPIDIGEGAGVQVENSFQSFTGWVQPGQPFPLQVRVRNFDPTPHTGVTVTLTPPAGGVLELATPLNGAGTATVGSDGTITWTVGELPGAATDGPAERTLVVGARAMRFDEDERIVWKDLSSTATLRYDGGPAEGTTSQSHGPKVIPPGAEFETARYGDKAFPVVPVEYVDLERQPEHVAEDLATTINDPAFEGSMFNLYQEMSYGQLFPEARVGSAGIASATFSEYEPGFDFTTPEVERGTCRGVTLASTPGAIGSPAFDTRIEDGWYQLPGNVEYYGGDYPAFTLGTASSIDSACGQLGKGVYDAAQIADPEIDYNDFDSDKDGIVDFFMAVFVGCGGNGASQLTVATCEYPYPPYDNIWPHSADLQQQYRDPETGLRGYTSDDQLVDLEGRPQCWTDDNYVESTTCASAGGEGVDELPTFVRVGPYNVNPETSFDSASVISHEYGHYLALPDYYSSYDTYGTYNLMAADYSQHLTVFSKQELGWVVPQFVQPGQSVEVDDWGEIKEDTGEIRWVTPDGEPYTLSAANGDQGIHNGQAYGVKLPPRITLTQEQVEGQVSAPTVLWSGRGNDFGCSPDGARNLDILLPELAELEPGTQVELRFKSSWDIEWDWDYGFVLVTTDGENYASQPSLNGYTTQNTYNPNNQQCFAELDNGITGQSGSYETGPQEVTVDRNPLEPDYSNPTPFLDDAYDLTEYAGQQGVVVRLSYFTDAAFDRPGWFTDDFELVAGEEVLWSTDLEADEPGRFFPGGCDPDGFNVAVFCTDGWSTIRAGEDSPTDHAYYLELRDRVGFDFNGYEQSDRGEMAWEPGVFIDYTDEAHGYGNNGVPQPPAQHYLNSTPEPGNSCPESAAATDPSGYTCDDWSFTAEEGRNRFQDVGNIQNFNDPSQPERDGVTDPWLFDYGCLTLQVNSMSGNEIPTENAPSDITADATISAGEGCAEFTYIDPEDLGLIDEVRRVSGPDRIATSVALSRDAFPTAPAAVLARADAFPDALAASSLAAEVGGPILLTAPDALDPRVAEELSRLGAAKVYLAGGESALSPAVQEALEEQRVTVVRVGGRDRYATAAAIADEVVELGGEVDRVTVALGDRQGGDAFPDALAAGNLANVGRVPVLLTRPGDLPDDTAEAIGRLLGDSGTAYVAGGTGAVSQDVEDDLAAAGVTVQRLAGSDRYATAVAIGQEAIALGAADADVVLASGRTFPDALAAAPAARALGGVLLLVDPASLDASSATAGFLDERSEEVDLAVIAGGTAAVGDDVLEEVLTTILDADDPRTEGGEPPRG